MRQKLLNIIAGVFFGLCCAVLLDIGKAPASKNIVAKHDVAAEFNQSFSGITKVIDGDSVRVGGNEIRLFGLDAPEYRQTCLNAQNEEYNCGQVSKKFLLDLANNKEATCHYSGKDIYDRFLAICYIGNVSINAEIVKNGMAVIYDYKTSSEAMDQLETHAKANKIGIWQGSFQLPKEYRKSQKKKKHA